MEKLNKLHKDLLKLEVDSDIALIKKVRDSIDREKCKKALEDHYIRFGSFLTSYTLHQCSAYIKIPRSEIPNRIKVKEIMKKHNDSVYVHHDDDRYFVFLSHEEFFKQ